MRLVTIQNNLDPVIPGSKLSISVRNNYWDWNSYRNSYQYWNFIYLFCQEKKQSKANNILSYIGDNVSTKTTNLIKKDRDDVQEMHKHGSKNAFSMNQEI